MSLVKQFDDELKGAMKASDSVKVSVLRMIKAAVKNKQIEKGGELGDDEVVSVLSSMVKQRRESIEQFSKAGRMDLVEREEQERGLFVMTSFSGGASLETVLDVDEQIECVVLLAPTLAQPEAEY